MKTMFLVIAWFTIAGVGAQTGKPAVQVSVVDVSCSGNADGRIDLLLVNGTPPVSFQWNNLSTGSTGNGQINQIGQTVALTGLEQGTYRFNFNAANGTDSSLECTIKNPLTLSGKIFILTNFGGFPVACAYENNGVALFDVIGGTPPIQIVWSNGDQDVRADSLSSGPLSVTVTDANGCSVSADTVLTVPLPLDADLSIVGETCFGENSGQIDVASQSGGIPPYRFSLNGGTLTSQSNWVDLTPGPYFVQMEDAAGCTLELAAILPTGLEFTLKLGQDTAIFTGDTVWRTIEVFPPADTLIWRPGQGVQLLSGNEIQFFPQYSTTFQVTAINGSGCSATDKIYIETIRNRDVYVPNVFAPQADILENRTFTVFGGGGIRDIEWLQVYDRFGRLWFEKRHFGVNDSVSGWDGTNTSDEAPAGVYLWRTSVRYTDGREVLLQGDVTVVR